MMAPKKPTRLISIDSETGSYWYGDNKIQADEKISALIEKSVLRKNILSRHFDQSIQRLSSIKSNKPSCSMS